MTYKRNIDRLAIPRPMPRSRNVVCHYCIVGCGYKAYTWPVGPRADRAVQNALGADLDRPAVRADAELGTLRR